ncbi:DUF5403 family protein [Puerhibacterium puerhi]|uniref:DUF5403 family protein n=1 Tax=Puerhibacterium puerhi TaxID=2692623 RepID=UPI001358AC59|nr:DUF5403 family protein [Puerhibacterium puerhi]
MAEVFKRAHIDAAQIAGDSAEMDAVADELAALARARAAGHGSLAGRIEVERSRKDRLVVLDHPEAAYVEFGHVHNRDRTQWVPGLHIMRNAYNDMPEGG